MKLKWTLKGVSLSVGTGLVALGAIAPFSTPPASAQCVMSDLSIQLAIRGVHPASQNNQVTQDSQGPCTGNTINQTNTQLYTGSGDVTQDRTSHQLITGGQGNGTGVNGPTIKVPVGIQVDVYNPAYDPQSFNWNRKPGNSLYYF